MFGGLKCPKKSWDLSAHLFCPHNLSLEQNNTMGSPVKDLDFTTIVQKNGNTSSQLHAGDLLENNVADEALARKIHLVNDVSSLSP